MRIQESADVTPQHSQSAIAYHSVVIIPVIRCSEQDLESDDGSFATCNTDHMPIWHGWEAWVFVVVKKSGKVLQCELCDGHLHTS